jgi:hypothetical protein
VRAQPNDRSGDVIECDTSVAITFVPERLDHLGLTILVELGSGNISKLDLHEEVGVLHDQESSHQEKRCEIHYRVWRYRLNLKHCRFVRD